MSRALPIYVKPSDKGYKFEKDFYQNISFYIYLYTISNLPKQIWFYWFSIVRAQKLYNFFNWW